MMYPTLKAFSHALYELMVTQIDKYVSAYVSVNGTRVTVHKQDQYRTDIASVDNAQFSEYFLKLEENNGNLEAINFHAHFIRLAANTLLDVQDYIADELMLFEATMQHYVERVKRFYPGFIAYCTFKYNRSSSGYTFSIYQTRKAGTVLPPQHSVPRDVFWMLLKKVDDYAITPDGYKELTRLCGNDLMAYQEGILASKLRLRKLEALIST